MRSPAAVRAHGARPSRARKLTDCCARTGVTGPHGSAQRSEPTAGTEPTAAQAPSLPPMPLFLSTRTAQSAAAGRVIAEGSARARKRIDNRQRIADRQPGAALELGRKLGRNMASSRPFSKLRREGSGPRGIPSHPAPRLGRPAPADCGPQACAEPKRRGAAEAQIGREGSLAAWEGGRTVGTLAPRLGFDHQDHLKMPTSGRGPTACPQKSPCPERAGYWLYGAFFPRVFSSKDNEKQGPKISVYCSLRQIERLASR